MRLPPWAIEAIRNGVADVARKASDAETISKVKEQAAELLRDLPENASRGIDAIVKTATDTARGAVDQGRESVLRWTQRQTDLVVRCHNASGVLYSPFRTGIPVSDAVLRLGCVVMRGDSIDGELRERIDHSISKMLDHDGHSIAVACSLDAAVAALGGLADSRTTVIHRSQAIRLPSGTPLPDAFDDLELQQCGGVQAIEPRDFDGIDQACVVLADNGNRPVIPVDFGRRDVVSIAILPIATIKRSIDSIDSAESLLKAGIDVVALPGGPLTGGTPAGILVGKKSLIESIRNHRRWNVYTASDATAATTLAAMIDSQASPLAALIDTSEENLRSRAERMATRLTAEESITTCQITDQPAQLVAGARWQFPSRQIRIRHRTLSAENWASRLIKQDPAVIASVIGDDLVVDLRWVAASDDAQLAEALGSGQLATGGHTMDEMLVEEAAE